LRASQLCQRMESALRSGRWQEAVSLGRKVLGALPSHLWAQSLLGQACLAYGLEEEARAYFHAILERDPECIPARIGLARQFGSRPGDKDRGNLWEGYRSDRSGLAQYDLSPQKRLLLECCERALNLWRLGSLQEAAREARQALQTAHQSLTAILILADIAWRTGDQEEFAKWFHQAQGLDPSGVVARRVLGDCHPLLPILCVDPFISVEDSEPVYEGELECPGSANSGGLSARKRRDGMLPPAELPWLLDSSPPSSVPSLSLHSVMEPSQVGVSMDEAGVPRGVAEAQADEDLATIERELEHIASSLGMDSVASALSSSRVRPLPRRRLVKRRTLPLQLIVSNRAALEAKYGPAEAFRIHQALTKLAEAMGQEGEAQTLVLYLDDAQALRPYGLTPVDPRDAGEIKSLLDQLEARLRDDGNGEGQAITYLLLVGGDDVVPFHRLPDLNGDEDGLVLSDHPYACVGDMDTPIRHPFCERAVGRLPDSASPNSGFLLRLIAVATEAHHAARKGSSIWQALGGWMNRPRAQTPVMSFGYTASIWRRAAREVFSSIGEPSHLRTSPPLTAEQMPSLGPIAPRLSYFNLHGLRDSVYWYGQRDPAYAASYPLFPVAIQPDNILVVPHPRSVVFSEACYGAHILNKDPTSSLALRFLAAQAVGMVGSTALAYGALDPPLMGADLLAKHFWEQIKAGLSLGEALRRAKQALIQDMLARQGYLDPEDEKTVLSFVLYGDPTLVVRGEMEEGTMKLSSKEYSAEGARHKIEVSSDHPLRMISVESEATAVCRRRVLEPGSVSPELLTHVRHCLASYLPPSMWEDVTVSAQALCHNKRCHGGYEHCEALDANGLPKGWASAGMDRNAPSGRATLVLTLQRKALIAEGDTNKAGVHLQIAKVTVDSRGNPVKIALSR